MRTLAAPFALVIAGAVGVVMMHHPMLFSGFARIQTSTTDTRFINYGLEHSYQWLHGTPPHRSFWDIPMFYPTRNVAAFSDTLLTLAPFYWVWRVVGFLPDTAFQLWMLTASVLNYLAGYWLMREGFCLGPLGSICGAFLFAFAAPRTNEVEHQQLSLQLYSVITLMALFQIFRHRTGDAARSFFLWAIAALSLVAQLYASFYLGWFLALALGFAAIGAVLLPGYRAVLIGVMRAQWRAIGCAAVLALLAIAPLVQHYLMAAGTLGLRDYDREVVLSIPDWRSWIYLGPQSWMYGWLSRLDALYFPVLEQAMRRGFGLVTSVLSVAGLVSRRRDTSLRLVGIVTIALIVAAMRFDHQVWERVAIALWTICAVQLVSPSRSARDRTMLAVSMLGLAATFFPAVSSRTALVAVALGVLVWAAWPSVTRVTVPASALAISSLVVCATAWLFPTDVVYWRLLAAVIPGGRALRVVSRALLLAIIPAAAGYGAFFDWAWESRRRLGWALALGVVSVLEQGVTTSSFAKSDARDTVADLARRVDRRWQCFYYSPRLAVVPVNPFDFDHVIITSHLDAMWTELATGVPTINGYSGSAPPGWHPLYASAVNRKADPERLSQALQQWVSAHSMPADKVGWIVGGGGDR